MHQSDAPDGERGAGGAVTRLSDLIRGQSSQEAMSPDAKGLAGSFGKTGLLIPSSATALPVAEPDWYQRASHALQGIKRAVQMRQPWTLEELTVIASGLVASL